MCRTWSNTVFSGRNRHYFSKWLKPLICCADEMYYSWIIGYSNVCPHLRCTDVWPALRPPTISSLGKALLCLGVLLTLNRPHRPITQLSRRDLSGATNLTSATLRYVSSCQRTCRSKSWTEEGGQYYDQWYGLVFQCIKRDWQVI